MAESRGMSREPGVRAVLGVVAATVGGMGVVALFHQAPPTLHPATVSGHIVMRHVQAGERSPLSSVTLTQPVSAGSYRIGDGPGSRLVRLEPDTAARYAVRTPDGHTVTCLLRDFDVPWQHNAITRRLPCLDVENGWDGPRFDTQERS